MLQIGEVVQVYADGIAGEAVVIALGNDDTVTVRSELTGRSYVVSVDDIERGGTEFYLKGNDWFDTSQPRLDTTRHDEVQ